MRILSGGFVTDLKSVVLFLGTKEVIMDSCGNCLGGIAIDGVKVIASSQKLLLRGSRTMHNRVVV